MSRTYRKPYRKSRVFSKSCRCHGSCNWCRDNRTYNDRKLRAAADAEIEELYICPGCGNYWPETETILEDGRLGCGVCEQRRKETNNENQAGTRE